MFDIGWSEILVIAVVAIIVVGPKELPKMLRTFGKTMGTVRRTANDFKRQFDEALREAERQADLGEARSTIESISRLNPVADLKRDILSPAAPKPPASATPSSPALPPAPETAPPTATSPAAVQHHGSDAA